MAAAFLEPAGLRTTVAPVIGPGALAARPAVAGAAGLRCPPGAVVAVGGRTAGGGSGSGARVGHGRLPTGVDRCLSTRCQRPARCAGLALACRSHPAATARPAPG